MTRRPLFWLTIGFEGGLAVLGWGLGAYLGTPAFGQWHLTGRGIGLGLLASVPALLGLAWVVRSVWPPFVRFRRTIDHTLAPLVADCTLVDLAVLSVMAGVGEEVLFRGVVQAALAGRIGPGLAVAVTALLFGLAHFVSVTYAVYATLFGVYLGVLLVVSGNLLAPVVTHAVYDFVALAYLVYVRPPTDAAHGGGHPRASSP